MMNMEAEPVKRGRGRPPGSKGNSKLNPEVIEKLCKAVESGLTYRAACGVAGIGYQTLADWRRRGATAKKGLYRELVDRLEVAEGRMLAQVENMMARMAFGKADTKVREQEGADGRKIEKEVDGRMLRFIAERRYPEIWGSKQQVTIGGGSNPLAVKLVDPTFIPGSAELPYDPDDPDDMG